MEINANQANHNQNFHDCIEQGFSDKFFDWKITILFYIAIHCMKALATKRGVDIGETHHEINRNISPQNPNRILVIPNEAWEHYRNLYNYSRTSRYNGFTDIDTFQSLMKTDYSYCKTHIERLKNYMAKNNVFVTPHTAPIINPIVESLNEGK